MTDTQGVHDVDCNLHHAHLFASNLDESVRFYQEMFGGEVIMDGEVAGSRNVLLRLGSAHINFYDQPPKDAGRGVLHHLGIRTNDLEALVERMKAKGFEFRKEITDLGVLKYVMAAAPDNVLLELFETKAL
jgi:catechol 2,3-dioxygenase-like lactoylglutathione lyase family enzyme